MAKTNKILKFSLIILVFVLSLGLVGCGNKEVTSFEKGVEALPETITLADATVINKLRSQYNRMTHELKDQVENYEEFVEKEDTLIALQFDVKVDNLPETLTLADAGKVEDVRYSYDNLTAAQQAKVSKLADLEAAEAAIEALQPAE